MNVKVVSGPSMVIRYNMYQAATASTPMWPPASVPAMAIEELQNLTEGDLEPSDAHRVDGVGRCCNC